MFCLFVGFVFVLCFDLKNEMHRTEKGTSDSIGSAVVGYFQTIGSFIGGQAIQQIGLKQMLWKMGIEWTCFYNLLMTIVLFGIIYLLQTCGFIKIDKRFWKFHFVPFCSVYIFFSFVVAMLSIAHRNDFVDVYEMSLTLLNTTFDGSFS